MTHHIVVLGAGYAGLGAAMGLARRAGRGDVRVTLVNAADRFVERVRLHQMAAGTWRPAHRLADLLRGTGIRLVVGRVTGLDPAGRMVRVDGAADDRVSGPARELRYDTLVYALGSAPDRAVPGVREHAYAVAGTDGADRARERLVALPRGGTVAVVGGGLTGIETAAELAQSHPHLRVTLVSGDPVGGWLSPRGRSHVLDGLERLGATIREGTRVAAVTGGGLRTDEGEVAADAVVWAAGFALSPLAAEAGLATDARRRLIVDETLRSASHPDVYGAGDAAAARAVGGETRMSCQTGVPMGAAVADVVTARLAGRRARPVTLRYVWQHISLGRRDALLQFTHADDTPMAAVVTGRAAAVSKEAVVRGAFWATRHPGAYPSGILRAG